MEISPRNYDEYRPRRVRASLIPRPCMVRPNQLATQNVFPTSSAEYCRELIDRANKLLQRVRENQHRIGKYLFTRITGETNELLSTLVMWKKHWFNDGLRKSSDIEWFLNKQPTFTELCHVLLPKLAPMWKAFCTVINFDEDGTTLAIIDQKYRGDPEECCREVLQRWLSFKRPTWHRVIDYLQQARCTQLAGEVEEFVVPDILLSDRLSVALKHVLLNALWSEYMDALRSDSQEIKTTATGVHENGKIVKIYNGGEKLTAVDTTIEDDLIRKFVELKREVATFFEREASEILKQLKKKTSSAGAGREWHTLGELLISLRFIHGQVGG